MDIRVSGYRLHSGEYMGKSWLHVEADSFPVHKGRICEGKGSEEEKRDYQWR